MAFICKQDHSFMRKLESMRLSVVKWHGVASAFTVVDYVMEGVAKKS